MRLLFKFNVFNLVNVLNTVLFKEPMLFPVKRKVVVESGRLDGNVRRDRLWQ